jgi:hypothetical protein
MPAERNEDGVITNAKDLTVDDVVGNRVLCPGCHDKVFQAWPEGWDAHAAYRCSGARGTTEAERKTSFKHQWQYLFR